MDKKKFNERYDEIISWMALNPYEKELGERYKKIYSREKLWTIIEEIQSIPFGEYSRDSWFVGSKDMPEFFLSVENNPDLMVQYNENKIFVNFMAHKKRREPYISYFILDVYKRDPHEVGPPLDEPVIVSNLRLHEQGISLESLQREVRNPKGWRVWDNNRLFQSFINYLNNDPLEVKE